MEPPEELEMRQERLVWEQMHMWEQEWRGQVENERRRERERERERVTNEELAILQAQQNLGPIGCLLFLIERHHKLIFALISLWIFEKIVTKLVDFNGFILSVLILVSLHFTLRAD